MLIVAEHHIHDPAAFWGDAANLVPNLPAHLKLHQSNPSLDGRRAVCVREAESIDAVRDYLESNLGHASRNEYYEVVNKDSMALPPAYQTA